MYSQLKLINVVGVCKIALSASYVGWQRENGFQCLEALITVFLTSDFLSDRLGPLNQELFSNIIYVDFGTLRLPKWLYLCPSKTKFKLKVESTPPIKLSLFNLRNVRECSY